MKGFIYKLFDGNLTYYGSSTVEKKNLRLMNHKRATNRCTSNKLDINKMVMTILEDREFKDIDELLWLEREYIENNECVNCKMRKPIYNEKDREIQKQRIKDTSKKWNTENLELIKKRRLIKIMCSCGQMVRQYDLPRHQKTKKHMKQLTNNGV